MCGTATRSEVSPSRRSGTRSGEAEWREWTAKLRLLTEPPDELVASIAWDSGDGTITSGNVWDTPVAVYVSPARGWRRSGSVAS